MTKTQKKTRRVLKRIKCFSQHRQSACVSSQASTVFALASLTTVYPVSCAQCNFGLDDLGKATPLPDSQSVSLATVDSSLLCATIIPFG